MEVLCKSQGLTRFQHGLDYRRKLPQNDITVTEHFCGSPADILHFVRRYKEFKMFTLVLFLSLSLFISACLTQLASPKLLLQTHSYLHHHISAECSIQTEQIVY